MKTVLRAIMIDDFGRVQGLQIDVAYPVKHRLVTIELTEEQAALLTTRVTGLTWSNGKHEAMRETLGNVWIEVIE